jgi:hypothetical protein
MSPSHTVRRTVLLACFLLGLGLGCTETGGIDLAAILEAAGPSSESQVASGLREALRVGTQRAVSSLSKPGGFANVAALRLELPSELQPAAQALRTVGMGKPVDDLETAMNQAAEKAAGEAVPVFADAIASMTISDAATILDGPDDAATRYFQQRTSAALRTRFSPIVDSAMQQVGVYRSYSEAMRLYDSIPFAEKPSLDLEGYVLDRTLSGLFGTLADEEARIREDPAARTTALLRQVFGTATKTD